MNSAMTPQCMLPETRSAVRSANRRADRAYDATMPAEYRPAPGRGERRLAWRCRALQLLPVGRSQMERPTATRTIAAMSPRAKLSRRSRSMLTNRTGAAAIPAIASVTPPTYAELSNPAAPSRRAPAKCRGASCRRRPLRATSSQHARRRHKVLRSPGGLKQPAGEADGVHRQLKSKGRDSQSSDVRSDAATARAMTNRGARLFAEPTASPIIS